MAKYKVDQRDVEFGLFEHLNASQFADGFEETDLKAMLTELIKYCENEIYPTRAKSDLEGVKLTADGVKVPECLKPVNKGYYENGFVGLGFPEELGGIPVPETFKVACDSIATGANMAWMLYPGLSKAAANVIVQVGTEEQKNKFVPNMMSGLWGGTMCLTEPDAGSDVGNLKTTATPNGDGTFNLKGVKHFISSGDNDLYENIIHLVLARTPDAPEGTKGLSLFLVPKYKINEDGSNGDANNLICTKIEEKMGIHASATCELTFGQGGDCVGEMIGEELEGMKNMFIMMNEARLYCGLQGESTAALAYELTKQYCEERVQFKAPIVNHPDVRRMLLKMRAMVRGMRGLSLFTGALFDEYHKSKDPKVNAEIGLLTPICKAFFTDEGTQQAIDALQLHGGYGYCTEYEIEQFVRDVKISTIYEGTNGIQAIDFVTRKILKDGGKTFMAFGERVQKTMNQADEKLFPEKRVLGASLGQAGDIATRLGGFAQKGEIDRVLEHATDFLSYCSNVVVAWVLLDHAVIAAEKIGSASGDDKDYYQSKIDDFKVYVQHYLYRNAGIAKSIMSDEAHPIMSYKV